LYCDSVGAEVNGFACKLKEDAKGERYKIGVGDLGMMESMESKFQTQSKRLQEHKP
jgi:hypothetical protein